MKDVVEVLEGRRAGWKLAREGIIALFTRLRTLAWRGDEDEDELEDEAKEDVEEMEVDEAEGDVVPDDDDGEDDETEVLDLAARGCLVNDELKCLELSRCMLGR